MPPDPVARARQSRARLRALPRSSRGCAALRSSDAPGPRRSGAAKPRPAPRAPAASRGCAALRSRGPAAVNAEIVGQPLDEGPPVKPDPSSLSRVVATTGGGSRTTGCPSRLQDAEQAAEALAQPCRGRSPSRPGTAPPRALEATLRLRGDERGGLRRRRARAARRFKPPLPTARRPGRSSSPSAAASTASGTPAAPRSARRDSTGSTRPARRHKRRTRATANRTEGVELQLLLLDEDALVYPREEVSIERRVVHWRRSLRVVRPSLDGLLDVHPDLRLLTKWADVHNVR